MGTTKIILAKDIANLGEEGDIKVVKRGYAQNFLIPQKLAYPFTLQNRNMLEKRQAIIEKKKLEKKSNAGLLKEKLEKEILTIKVPAGEKGRLYGTVTNIQIADELAKLSYAIDKKSIELKEHIKVVGNYKYSIHLYQDLYADMTLVVESLTEEKTEPKTVSKRKKAADSEEIKEESKDAEKSEEENINE